MGCLCGILGGLLGVWAGSAMDVAETARMRAAGETVDSLPALPIIGILLGGFVGMLFGAFVAIVLNPPPKR
jgi:hypothetical protein